jgi:serine protease Do
MKKINAIIYLFFGFMIVSLIFPVPGRGEVLKLKNGSWIDGKILKKTDQIAIIDLGYDVLRIPILEISEISNALQVQMPVQPPIQTMPLEQKNSLYNTTGFKEKISTVESFQDFVESVVVVRTPGGLGSGFIINNKGYIITNFHVIQGQKHINITRFQKTGQELKRIVYKNIRIVALDPFHDLAVLKLEDDFGQLSRPMVFCPGDHVEVGEKIFVIGNPMGLERSVTEGVISHTGRIFAGKVFLQVDAAINPGNSGGPLFNNHGQVIGVINMGARFMQGLNFAIPIHHVKFLLDHIDSFTYNESNPLSGYVYPFPPRNPNPLKKEKGK